MRIASAEKTLHTVVDPIAAPAELLGHMSRRPAHKIPVFVEHRIDISRCGTLIERKQERRTSVDGYLDQLAFANRNSAEPLKCQFKRGTIDRCCRRWPLRSPMPSPSESK